MEISKDPKLAVSRSILEKLQDAFQLNARALTLRLLCGVIWAAELFWAQGLGFKVPPETTNPVLIQSIRFFMDIIAGCGLCLLLPRRVLIPLNILNVWFFACVATYAQHFPRPLMPITIFGQWREGLDVVAYSGRVLAWGAILVTTVTMLLKCFLLIRSGRPVFSQMVKRIVLGFFIGAYLFFVILLQFSSFDFFRVNAQAPRCVYAYGYTLPWLFEISVFGRSTQLAPEVYKLFEEKYDSITPVEDPIQIKNHLVIVQLETVGTAAISAKYRDTLVMPFLHGLKNQSMFFRIRSFHNNGSCDMDFAATTFTRPYPSYNPYRIKGIKYTNSMPGFAKKHGMSTHFFHGNTGKFFDRQEVIDRLEFDGIYFKEQLLPLNLQSSFLGARDAEMFRVVLSVLRETERAYAFLITLDTHTPYTYISATEQEIFTNPQNEVERYFNSLRYLDNCLTSFVKDLPEGTTLVIYGDHTAYMKTEMFSSDVVGRDEFVGCLIYQKGTDLSKTQKTRQMAIATSGELNLLDVLSFLRASIAASSPEVAKDSTAHSEASP
jgi:Phosphoglycerol transferase and related proteins, alkaline phosphatase superfamily